MPTQNISPAQSRRSYQQELVPSRKNQSSETQSERANRYRSQNIDQGQESYKNRRARRNREPEAEQPASPPSIQPTPTQPVESSPTRSLAERYVAQYETQSGNTLSQEARAAKVQEVESFYGDSSRQGRLEKIVFA